MMHTSHPTFAPGIGIDAPVDPEYATILTPAAVSFVAFLQRGFRQRLKEILEARLRRQAERDAGRLPDLLPGTAHIRADDTWQVMPCPADLADRKAELTIPARRDLLARVHASGASACMIDLEDALAPSWSNIMEAQLALREAATDAAAATLLVRPRGWHLEESHMTVDGSPCAAAIFDVGLHLHHHAKILLERGSGPYFCLPKMQSHLEARLWNDIFCLAQDELGVPRGSIRAAVMIETLDAAFEMEEMLYELREHCAGLKFGKRDYLFSVIKTLHRRSGFCLAERAFLEVQAPYLRHAELLMVKTCHRRGTLAIGATATDVPISASNAANDAAFALARETMERDAGQGFDGAGVAHPGMVAAVRSAFGRAIPGPNQISHQRNDVSIDVPAMLDVTTGVPISETGLQREIRTGISWCEGWLKGNGCTLLDNRVEDTASAELARTLVWHWIRSPNGVLGDGRKITRELISSLIHVAAANGGVRAGHAAAMFEGLCMDDAFPPFITTATRLATP